jgi:hypothetical protein
MENARAHLRNFRDNMGIPADVFTQPVDQRENAL